MTQNVRLATENDMPKVLELIKELASFERAPDAVEITIDQLKQDGFRQNPAFRCFIGEIDNEIHGMALVYMRYSTWKGEVLHLEDLIIDKKARGLGLGTKLLDAVIKYGYELKVKRVSWVVLDWNKTAIDFYIKKGAHILHGWDIVQLDEQGIKNYISKLD